MRMTALLTVALAISLAGSAQAAVITWDGDVDGDWNNLNNWDLGRIPTDGDDIVLPAGAPNQNQSAIDIGASGGPVLSSLDIQGGGYTVGNTAATLVFGNDITSVGNNVISAGVEHYSEPTYTSTGGELAMIGTHSIKNLKLDGSGDFRFDSPVQVSGNRWFDMSATGTARFNDTLGAFLKVFSSNRAGGVRMQAAGTILINDAADPNTVTWGIGRSGTLGGNGSLGSTDSGAIGSGSIGIGYQPNTAQPSGNGTLAPGDPLVAAGIGSLDVTVSHAVYFGGQGDVTDPATLGTTDSGTGTGTLAIGIDSAGVSDVLNITGDLNLASENDVLQLDLIDGAAPSGIYTIATFTGTRTGKFNTVMLGSTDITATAEGGFDLDGSTYRLEYTNGSIQLLPEPGTMALLALGGLAVLRRRR